ncbi:MAG: TetR/AcrR family transcriptional regulator [Sulfitobacter sp.]
MKTPGRPREFDPEEALAQIMNLFWEKGYEATGLSDMIAVTGLGKASLYAAFGNKQAIYLKALAQYEGLVVDVAAQALRAQSHPPMQRIEAFLTLPIAALRDQGDWRGCFLCNASADRAALDADTGALVQRGYEKMRRAIAQALGEADAQGDAQVIAAQAQLVLVVYSGLRVMARSGIAVEQLELATQQALRAVAPV